MLALIRWLCGFKGRRAFTVLVWFLSCCLLLTLLNPYFFQSPPPSDDKNFNPMMATAGKVTVAEVEELVEPGALGADAIHTPGIFVQRILAGSNYEKRIEQRTTRARGEA